MILSGFGISTRICDNEHVLLCVDMDKKEVSTREAVRNRDTMKDAPMAAVGAIIQTWTFDEFVAADFKEDDGD